MLRNYLLLIQLLVVGLTAVGLTAVAQTLPVLEQTPASLRWYRLTTPHFRVLYPDGLDSTAQRTAQRLERLYEPVSASLNKTPRRISLLLQNQTTNSNGFVTLFPRRSEFNAVPPQDPGLLGTFNWLDLLAVHEYRHVVQFDKALQGYGRFFYTIFGNTGLYFPSFTVPDWFAEGDAVSTETLFSTSGRGRIPNFDLGMRANLLAGERFDYPKAVCGSYVDNVPSYYTLGYFMTTYLKLTYGPDAWSRVLNRNYHRFPWPFAFSASINDETGLRTEDLYRKTMDDLTEMWQQQQAQLSLTSAELFPVRVERQTVDRSGASPQQPYPRRPVFTNYQHPQFLTDSTVLCVKSGLGDVSQLVVLTKHGKEKTVIIQGPPNDPSMLSATSTKACWIEYGFDPRWGQRIYSNIRVYDFDKQNLTRLTHRARYLAVALSPDNSKLVVVQNTPTFTTQLLVLDAQKGKLIQTLSNPDNEYYLHPRWQADNMTVVVVALKNRQKTIQTINTQTGTRTNLLPWANENLSNPQPWGDYVLYNSPRSGIDNIYALNVQTKQVYQVTSRPLAAYHATASPSGTQLAFEDFAATGSRIATMPLRPADWQEVATNPSASGQPQPVRFFGKLPQLEPGAAQGRRILADSVPGTSVYQPSRFRRLAHAINVYNWGPSLSSTGQALSVGLSSQDLLSTTQIGVGYTYNQAERVGNFYANLSYQALYPIIDVSVQRGSRNTSLYIDRYEPLDSLRSDRWQYNQLTAGVRLPLLLTNSRYLQSMSLSAYYNYLQVSGYDLPYRYVNEVGSAGSLSALTYGFSYSRQLRQSKRDVAPRWGQALSVVYKNTPFGGKLMSEQWGVQGNLFFPGLAKHHSLRLRAGYQQQLRGTYQFNAIVFYPRGQSYVSDDKLTTGSAEYRLPIADMHWSIGRLLYLQRIKANGFFDFAAGQSLVDVRDNRGTLRGYQTLNHNYNTAGLDLSFVFNVLRLHTPFEAGMRAVYNLTNQQLLIQPLVIDIGL